MKRLILMLFLLLPGWCAVVVGNVEKELVPDSFNAATLAAGDQPYEVHLDASVRRVSERLGVRFESLERFYEALAAGELVGESGAESGVCLRMPEHNIASRSAFLDCLALHGKSALSEALFRRVFDLRIQLNREIPSGAEELKTIALLALIEDIIRETRIGSGLAGAWFAREHGFLESTEFTDFEYEDGDILLVLGGSSISALIAQSTFPPRKFSHAMMLQVRDGKLRTMETLIETGALSRDEEEFSHISLNVIQVLRWADVERRPEIAAAAANKAMLFAAEGRPYDMAVDLTNSDKLFCSELVALAYSEASGLPIDELIPEFGLIRSPEVLAYLSLLGVSNPVMVSPGDLSASGRFEVVAEYRQVDSLSRLWELLIMGDVFVERLELGVISRPRLLLRIATFGAAVGDFMLGIPRALLGVDLALIPASMDARAVSTMLTQEKVIFRTAFEEARKQMGEKYSPSMLYLKPWEYRAALSWAVQESRKIRRVFR